MTTGVKQQLIERITAALSPESLEVVDESAAHAGHASAPAGGESHFRVIIRASQLRGISRVSQHRAIYAACAGLMPTPVHALAIEVLETS